MKMLVLVWLSVLKNEADTPGFLASPLRQGERTKVRGFAVRTRQLLWSAPPSASPSPCKGRGDPAAQLTFDEPYP
jgi:hypothetical protein